MANVNVMQTLQHLEQKKQRLEDELRMVEKQVRGWACNPFGREQRAESRFVGKVVRVRPKNSACSTYPRPGSVQKRAIDRGARRGPLSDRHGNGRQVYDLETSYLNDSNQNGNVLKGFEGYLAPTKTQKCAPPIRALASTTTENALGFGRTRSCHSNHQGSAAKLGR